MSPKIVDKERLQVREQELLDVALSIIEREGVAGLNMDRLAAQVPYSKGTIITISVVKRTFSSAFAVRA